MLKSLLEKLEKTHNEKFSYEYVGNKIELWSKNHLYEYNSKTGQLIKLS